MIEPRHFPNLQQQKLEVIVLDHRYDLRYMKEHEVPDSKSKANAKVRLHLFRR